MARRISVFLKNFNLIFLQMSLIPLFVARRAPSARVFSIVLHQPRSAGNWNRDWRPVEKVPKVRDH